MTIELAIDTNAYRAFVDGEPETCEILRRATRIVVPFVVVAELRAGFAVGTQGGRNSRVFEEFLTRPRVALLYPTMETTRHYANLYRQLRSAGTPIPTNDLWIAAIAVQHSLMLCSHDGHFDALPQIPRLPDAT